MAAARLPRCRCACCAPPPGVLDASQASASIVSSYPIVPTLLGLRAGLAELQLAGPLFAAPPDDEAEEGEEEDEGDEEPPAGGKASPDTSGGSDELAERPPAARRRRGRAAA